MKVSIRRARPDDAAALTDCLEAAYAPFVSSLEGLPDMASGVAEDIAQHIVWVAEQSDDGKPADGKPDRPPSLVGGMILIPQDDCMKLANIAVLPAASGQGLGGRLLARAEEAAREHGHHTMRLTTHAGMLGNINLYRHLGWQETGRTGHAVHMEKTLSAPAR